MQQELFLRGGKATPTAKAEATEATDQPRSPRGRTAEAWATRLDLEPDPRTGHLTGRCPVCAAGTLTVREVPDGPAAVDCSHCTAQIPWRGRAHAESAIERAAFAGDVPIDAGGRAALPAVAEPAPDVTECEPNGARRAILPAPFTVHLPADLARTHAPRAAAPPADRRPGPRPSEHAVVGSGLLPTIGDGSRRTSPALLLALYDDSTRDPGRGRHGAPAPLRIFIETLLAIPVESRNGHLQRLRFSLRTIATDWLAMSEDRYRKLAARERDALLEAVRNVSRIEIPINDRGGFYLPLMLEAVSGRGRNDYISILSRIPSDGRVGASVDRELLRTLGKISGPAYRAYLSLCMAWDRTGAIGAGDARPYRRVIRATRPEVRRDAEGFVVDAGGAALTAANGRRVLSPYHERAVPTGAHEPNPRRAQYPEVYADDLVVLAFPRRTLEDPSYRRVARIRARDAIRQIAALEGCSIEEVGTDPANGNLPWRIMPYDPEWATLAAPGREPANGAEPASRRPARRTRRRTKDADTEQIRLI